MCACTRICFHPCLGVRIAERIRPLARCLDGPSRKEMHLRYPTSSSQDPLTIQSVLTEDDGQRWARVQLVPIRSSLQWLFLLVPSKNPFIEAITEPKMNTPSLPWFRSSHPPSDGYNLSVKMATGQDIKSKTKVMHRNAPPAKSEVHSSDMGQGWRL